MNEMGNDERMSINETKYLKKWNKIGIKCLLYIAVESERCVCVCVCVWWENMQVQRWRKSGLFDCL